MSCALGGCSVCPGKSMRRTALLPLFILLTTAPASSEILYARPDARAADTRYRWGDEIVRDSLPLAAALAVVKAANGAGPVEIRAFPAAGGSATGFLIMP